MEATANTTSVEIELSEEDALIQATVRDILEREGARDNARTWWSNDNDYDRAVWGKLAELGLSNMAGSAEHGGIDASPLTVAVVAESLGYFAAALPFEMHSTALRLLAEAGAPAVAGTENGVLTVAFSPNANGLMEMVPEGAVADAVVVPAGTDLLVASEFERTHIATMGMNRFANLVVAPSSGAHVTAEVDAIARAKTFATMLFGSRLVGLGDWMLSECVSYAGSRVQFGRPIGSFQAIQHKLSEMHIAMAATRFLVRHAAMVMGEGGDGALETARAKAFAGSTLWRVGTEAHQIHGGIGFILDHHLHLYFSQARGADSLYGSVRENHVAVGKALLVDGKHRPNAMLGVA